MKDSRVLLAALGVLLFQSLLIASPQWLQYRTSDHARDMLGSSRYYRQTQMEAPAGVELPEFKTEAPVFYKWDTPMDPAGFRWVAFDRGHQYGLYDIVYIDADGDGVLADEKPIEGHQTSQYEVEFGIVPVYFKGDDGPITYHLNIGFYSYNDENRYTTVSTGCWYEGQVDIGGQTKRCVLVDYNGNGAFDEKTTDRILIGPESSPQTSWVGNYLEIGDALYRLSMAKDGAFVELKPAPDVAYGTVTMPETITSFAALGDNGMFERTVTDSKVMLPEGKYRVYSWKINRKDDKGVDWTLSGNGFREETQFSVTKDDPVHMDIGEPVFCKLDNTMRSNSFYFNQSLVGKYGEQVSLNKNNRRPSAPKIHIRNKTGKYDRTFTLEYG